MVCERRKIREGLMERGKKEGEKRDKRGWRRNYERKSCLKRVETDSKKRPDKRLKRAKHNWFLYREFNI